MPMQLAPQFSTLLQSDYSNQGHPGNFLTNWPIAFKYNNNRNAANLKFSVSHFKRLNGSAMEQNMRLCVKRSGKLYDNGRYYARLLREQILDMIRSGISLRTTATELKTSWCFVQNVLADYDCTGCSLPQIMKVKPERRVMYRSN